MFKLTKEFEILTKKANELNSKLGKSRFHTIFQTNKRFITVGIYDSQSKKYEIFDSINFAGNYRYNKNVKPKEFARMEKMLSI